MLRLNPGDNQGVRYLLLSWLLDTGDDVKAECLLADYDGRCRWSGPTARPWSDSACMVITGRQEAARRRPETNPYVPTYLLGGRRLPSSPDARSAFDDSSGSRPSEQLGAASAAAPPQEVRRDVRFVPGRRRAAPGGRASPCRRIRPGPRRRTRTHLIVVIVGQQAFGLHIVASIQPASSAADSARLDCHPG